MVEKQRKIKDLEQLLSLAGSNLNILEEEIDIQVQKEYFTLLNKLSQDQNTFSRIIKEYAEHINDLFDEGIDIEVKKRMLVVLATVDDVAVYRTIENFSKQESVLQKWAIIALQQSRILLQSSLLEDSGFFISTGLGGQGSLLRYFCVFPYRTHQELPEFQKNILKNELGTIVHKVEGKIEEFEFHEHFSTALLLFSLQTDILAIFSGLIEECNQYGNFLHENIIITNVKKLTEAEIYEALKKQRPPIL